MGEHSEFSKINIKVLNARSICSDPLVLRELIIDEKIDIFCITETWLHEGDTVSVANLVPDTHVLYHVPRPTGKGGGVGVVLSKSFQSSKFFDRSCPSFECLELIVSQNNKKFSFYIIYKPPNTLMSSFASDFESFLLESEGNPWDSIYVGDFNIWIEIENDINSERFRDILESFNLKNIVNSPTHISGHTLDLVITRNTCEIINELHVDPANILSDHSLISFQIESYFNRDKFKTIRFHCENPNLSIELLNCLERSLPGDQYDCEHDSVYPCVDCSANNFRSISSDVFKKCCPSVSKIIKIRDCSEQWFNPAVDEAKRKLRKAEKKYKRNRSDGNLAEYKYLLNRKSNIVAAARKVFISQKIEKFKNNPKQLARQLSNLLGRSKSSFVFPSHLSEAALVNEFKDYFIRKIENITNSFDNDTSSLIFLNLDLPLKTLDIFQPVTEEKTLEFISQMKKTFCLNDPIDVSKLNFLEFKDLSKYYCDIINCAFYTGKFPEKEKFSYVRPMIKKGNDPDSLASYRPLYTTSFLSKLIEKAILNQLYDHISNFRYLPWFQSAYRSLHSVETALCRVYSDLVISNAKGYCSILVLLDLSSAFDTLDQNLLLHDLRELGIEGKAYNLVASYLSNRKFRVSIGDSVSDVGSMKSGVPQGTILGPFLFIIYTSSLQHILDSLDVSYHFYADDTQIYFRISNKQDSISKLQNISSKISEWMNQRKLKLNMGKTDMMLIGSDSKLSNLNFGCNIDFGGLDIALSSTVRDLGVIFDKNLSLKNQILSAKSKAICGLINISRIAAYINKKQKTQLIHSLVLTQIDYCNSLYYSLPNRELNIFQMIINSSARVIAGLPRFSRERITPICIELHFLPLKARIVYKICLLTYKALKFGQPKYLSDLLRPYSTTSVLELRSAGRLAEPFISRAKSVERSFEYSAPRLYNSLPSEVKEQSTVYSFRSKLKTYLFTKAYDLDMLRISDEFRTR